MWKRQKGFTLIELMVTLAVLGVIIGLAVPSFNLMLLNNRSSTLGEELINAFSYARSEAVKRSTRVSVCVSNNGVSCTGETNWQAGFIVYKDSAGSDSSTTTTISSVSDVLKVWRNINPKALVSVQRGGANAAFVRFTAIGVLARNNGNPVTVTSSTSGCSGNAGRIVNINFAGQIRTSNFVCP